MYGDFSRLTFAAERGFSALWLQQGRVSVDADVNEQTAIMQHLVRTLAADLIGPYGGPGDAPGFGIAMTLDVGGDLDDLTIGAGHYYVDGVLCDNPNEKRFLDQPHRAPGDLPDAVPLLVYLRVFEQWVSSLDVPDIREIALGGPDTAGRTRVVWQVLVTDRTPGTDDPLGDVSADDVRAAWADWAAALRPTGRLRAVARRPEPEPEPCRVRPESSYRGVENQLYRVEIHTGGTAKEATFKMSRENGSACYAIESRDGLEVTLRELGPDRRLGLDVGDWVEIVDDRLVHAGRPEALRRVAAVDRLDHRVTLAPPPQNVAETATGADRDAHPFLRRWDQRPRDEDLGDDGAVRVRDGWLALEDGIEVEFDPDATYRRGDYWLIPARVDDGDIEWPRDDGDPAFRRPFGVADHLAPLALITRDGQGDLTRTDLRSRFAPLAQP
ncbi:DUF6519 domain-containing protein [Actinomycetospora cinnamomea]|uniref:Uncharacterized protein n=1 Tax=Actinomycetospora cinnamomea TaxID=663609 RepID=A0A2U1F7N8_9PSEU|nr:DUF6519 domain-containing protein [Actinomycetospora cinnamomea]PVZ08207.1 hypothetical protein C8D89_10990 [Actinomycetospora cinnamomea]